ncbi:unnamed protein product [Pedinophyceae sp. YPF-701]|nr:unnamed protein product [Pedinophyceae sp. YPF-701]
MASTVAMRSVMKGAVATQGRQASATPAFSGLARPARVVAGSRVKSASFAAAVSRAITRPRAQSVAVRAAATMAGGFSGPQKILLMGGTRFIGVYLARMLVEAGHEVYLFTRGKTPIAERIPDDTDESFEKFKASVKHIAGDRNDYEDLKAKISQENFDVVFDCNAREAVQVEPVLEATKATLKQYIFCSSAGVYLKSYEMPHREEDATDPACRHKGKLDSEAVLAKSGIPWTSLRPVYIYGPLNYNPVEEYFFHRIAAGRPVCVPGSGMQITQLGHIKDLAVAFVKCMGNEKAFNQIYNISGVKNVTFSGLAKACAQAAGKPEPEIVLYNPKDFDFGKLKAFPFRDQHFFASVDKAMADLDWEPEFGLVDGLKDSWDKDYSQGRYIKPADFTCDDMVLEKIKGSVPA